MKQCKIKIKEVYIEVDGRLVRVLYVKKNILEVRDAASDSNLLIIDMKKVNRLSESVKKYESIESCDILCAMIFDFLRTGQKKEFKNVHQFLKDKEFLALCFDHQMNYVGSVLESME